ncbi:hypothetical protein scyTo_0010496 [Scyliorhinus torazame]|uniref:Uncharacterized protein n=1 Tax=Scyliorhinus torazame TaxID=75743 RepID=A0A401P7I1_SCYTO|nr:hypothetical protein [Scyliorhinus torazame]
MCPSPGAAARLRSPPGRVGRGHVLPGLARITSLGSCECSEAVVAGGQVERRQKRSGQSQKHFSLAS